MNPRSLLHGLRPLCLSVGLLLAAVDVSAQDADPPGRVARLNLVQGTVSQLVDGQNDWSAAELNRPLTTGDRLHAEPGARLELHSGSTAVRLDGPATLDISQLDDNTTRLTLGEGRLNLRVRNLYPGEQVEIGTPNLALTVQQPGSFSVEVDPRSGTTRVAARAGTATVYGDNAESFVLSANGQQLSFAGRNLAQAAPPLALQNDGFDLWADGRDRAEDQSISARYVSRDVPGYQQLDSFGDWQNDTTYGAVWIPRTTVAEWAPYRYGQWRWIAPWGWTWVDDAPWGFAPFHYGRWAQIGPRWAWVPGPKAPRPTYAPALVGFLGGPPGRADWNLTAGREHRPGPDIGWFPLAPGEAWRPGFNASPRYLGGVNRDGRRQDGRPYFFQGRPHAVTAMPQVDFGRGPSWRPNRPNLRDGDLAGAQLLQAPPMPGMRNGNDRPQWNGAARSQAEQAQRAQMQADAARQRQQEALQRPTREFQAQQDRQQREQQLQQLQQNQQNQQQRQWQMQREAQRERQRDLNDAPGFSGGRPSFQPGDALRREQQDQQQRMQRDTAQREQIQRQQQLQLREQQNQQEQQRAQQQAQQAQQADRLRREQQGQQRDQQRDQQARQQRDAAQREQMQRQQAPQRPQFQQQGQQQQPQFQPMPRQVPQMLPGNNREQR